MKLYTKAGDGGETALFDGTRVPKSDARVEAYGEIDELSAILGVIRAHGVDALLDARLGHIQRDLFALGARLADPSHRIAPRVTKVTIDPDDIGRLERWIDELEAALPPLAHFIMAGGTQPAAALHLARAVCRRAERRIVGLGVEAVDPEVLAYVNRLSDLLFVMARAVNHRAGVHEQEW